jgi:hypothetical protein
LKKLLLFSLAVIAGCNRDHAGKTSRDSLVDSVAAPSVSEPASKPDLIRLDQPLPNSVVTSPLSIQGQARGPWFFEASFPVYLLDAGGDTIAVIPAQAEGEWMTREFVPFKATLTFTPPASATGTLVLSKDNPSGLPEHDDELRVPVRFH